MTHDTLQETASERETVKQYQDDHGRTYFVKPGIGGDVFKTFYRKPGSRKEHSYGKAPWRHTFDEAARDLAELAMKKNWIVISYERVQK